MCLLGNQTLLPAGEEPQLRTPLIGKQKAEHMYGRLVCTDTTQNKCRRVAPDVHSGTCTSAREHGSCVGPHCFLVATVALRGSGTAYS